ncbi:MAG: hypothetical protein ACLTZM_08495 [Ruminococcus sp.]
MDKKMATELLKEGKTFVKDLYSARKDKYFDAVLLMTVADWAGKFQPGLFRGRSAKEGRKGKKRAVKNK